MHFYRGRNAAYQAHPRPWRPPLRHSLGSSCKCNTLALLGIGCCDGPTKQAPQQRGRWRDSGGGSARHQRNVVRVCWLCRYKACQAKHAQSAQTASLWRPFEPRRKGRAIAFGLSGERRSVGDVTPPAYRATTPLSCPA